MLYCNQFPVQSTFLKGGAEMTTHILTTEQMHKFFYAVGGVPKTEIAGGSFTTDYLRKLTESIDGLQDWPEITDDPKVNFAVDCVVGDESEEPSYDEQLYTAEVEVFRAHGLFA